MVTMAAINTQTIYTMALVGVVISGRNTAAPIKGIANSKQMISLHGSLTVSYQSLNFFMIQI